ncbi:nucleoside triphosphate pyrophosphohydrolase [Alkalihalophilus lindianensis]|uniref:Nucleoside triphosphate pyrophosphohydrolase n=1 Tax=Alkalihalophilus lindianensis TaxID=1630542 RepID=A0ABU3X4K5_9BACI|nr:nucleoside triphosphate pyrophosphohydrolase [Alkalihalophilus lindianensis]MDV2682830.1 nucleoside triphosphate pyrophosphohydrolase [Alkalihalophilus lindianensis]
MPRYDKLVRDRIPAIITEGGKACRVERLDQSEFEKELRLKLQEEMTELIEAHSGAEVVEEIADVIEVMYALAALKGASPDEVERVRQRKHAERGGFRDRLFLLEVKDRG